MGDILLFLFLIVPLVHLIHESGHVVVARCLGIMETRIVLGAGPTLMEFSFFNTTIIVKWMLFLGGYSTNDREARLSYAEIGMISLGGSLFNLVSIAMVLPFYHENTNVLWNLFLLFSGWIGIINLLPFKIGEKKSDGWLVMTSFTNIIKNRRRNR